MDRDHTHRDLRSYGRRRGRTPSPRQAGLWRDLLPRVAMDLSQPAAPARLRELFGEDVDDIWLEIGFGGGEHLLWHAQRNPSTGILGCEPFQDGVIKVLSAIELENIANVRLHADDARPLLRWLPDSAISRAFILFPDPWPKARHHKRRLVSERWLRDLARVMRRGGELRLATDDTAYMVWMLQAVASEGSFRWTAQGPQDWRLRPADWPPTRYELKALEEGRRCYYLRFQRR